MILVADEDNDTRVILRTVLERNRYVVVEATTGDAAFEAAQQHTFDLVILNYPMADASGETLVRRLRHSSVTRFVPILNITSRVVPQFLLEAAAEGVDLTLPKPLDVESLLAVVSDLTGAVMA
jgi:CheY-like chemotaxis protein